VTIPEVVAMKVLLVKPHLSPATIAGSDYVELEPLELEYLAAALRNHDVDLIDMRYEQDLESKLHAFRPHIVAATAYSVHVNNALAVLRAAKQIDDDVFTVVGGHHATVMPHDFRRAGVDAVVCGEGAFTFRELVDRLESGAPIGDVPGLWHRIGAEFVYTGPRNDIHRIDELPLPDRELTARYRSRYFYLWWKPAALMRASAGCAYRCAFCPIWVAAGGKWCYRAPERVVKELAGIRERFVYFCDDNAFFDREKMATLCRMIEARGIAKEYFFFSRADAVVRCRDLIEKWAGIGLRHVFLGLEAVDPAKLRGLNKRTDARVNAEAVAILKANGIDPFAGFILLPDSIAEDFDRIYDYMEKLRIYYCEITVLTPAPGTDLYWKSMDRLTSREYELFDYMHPVLPTRLGQREFCRRLARLYWRSYTPARLLRLRPRTKPPLTPRHLARTLFVALRNRRAVRNGYRPDHTHGPVNNRMTSVNTG
jgi:radical SAM superfamily enzyme YgiQ (UPF0313 family)